MPLRTPPDTQRSVRVRARRGSAFRCSLASAARLFAAAVVGGWPRTPSPGRQSTGTSRWPSTRTRCTRSVRTRWSPRRCGGRTRGRCELPAIRRLTRTRSAVIGCIAQRREARCWDRRWISYSTAPLLQSVVLSSAAATRPLASWSTCCNRWATSSVRRRVRCSTLPLLAAIIAACV